MSEVRITAEPRTEFGKGAARRTRRAGKVPAVLYGHGEPPRHISLPGHELMRALRSPNVLFNLELNGKLQLALPKDVQRHPVRGYLEHVDLIVVRRGERVTVEVPIHVIGDIAPGGLLTHTLTALTIEADPTRIPANVEVSVDGMRVGTGIRAGDVQLVDGVTLVTDPEHDVVHVVAAPTAAQIEAQIEGAPPEAAPPAEEPTPAPERPAAAES